MKIEAYVDGSYRDGKVGWGAVILKDGKIQDELCGVMNDEDVQGTRQVAGELKAVKEALLWCQKHKGAEITIHYDYAGIKAWVSGEWKAKIAVTQEYRDFVRESGLKIHWFKVKSHSGNKYNDMADELAAKLIGD